MNQSAAARAYLAERHLFVSNPEENVQSISVTDPAFIPALRKCVEEYEIALNDLSGAEISEFYIHFILNWYKIASEENLKLYLNKLAQRSFKACEKKDRLSKTLYEEWAQFALEQKDVNRAKNVLESGLKTHPDSTSLWLIKIQMTQDPLSVYRKGLEANPESLLLWTSYKDWIFEQWGKENVTIEETDALFSSACDKATLLLPSMTSESSDRNEIKILIQSSYVEWASMAGNIQLARTVYKKILQNSYPTYEFIMKCLEIENQLGNVETGPKHVEFLLEKLLTVNNVDKEGKPTH
ncbi:hypothetical protein G6F56_008650 [Rhizopus delemar]|nr:hypothetical protein G6F56_008650 [Rhizopus delemar]